ncbi:MAG: HEPN domain-containing protein [Nitrospira sp.]
MVKPSKKQSRQSHSRHQSFQHLPEDLCFDAQQAAEKAIKALLLYRGITFPFVHDLAELVTVLQRNGEEVPAIHC